MRDLWDNELVKKYFTGEYGVKAYMADTILRAMQEPIREGERYIYVDNLGHMHEEVCELEAENSYPWHPNVLRLPNRFQVEKKECVEELHGPNCWHREDESRKQGHWEKFCPNKPSECAHEMCDSCTGRKDCPCCKPSAVEEK